ncbi:Hypothetical protein POVR1_LOCUS320 [uncultured virus]|nr:Hypothetical protein POVR1_LOCUS320 [uncultured virus]
MMWLILCLVTLSLQSDLAKDGCGCHCEDDTVEVDNYDRLIVFINAKSSPATTADILDINHTAWKALNIHPARFFPSFDASAFQFFERQFGIPFGQNCTPGLVCTLFNASGVPYVTLIPYKLVFPTYRLTIDSQNTERAPEGWNIWNFGYIARFLQAGRFTSGVAANTTYGPGDIISYTIKHFLKIDGDWDSPCDIELMLGFSPNPALQPINSQGFTDQLIFETIIPCEDRTYLNSVRDCDGYPGIESVQAHTFVDYITGRRATITTNVMRFPGTGLRPLT